MSLSDFNSFFYFVYLPKKITTTDLNKTYGDIVMEKSNNIPIISLFNRSDIEKVLQFNSGKITSISQS